MRLHLYLLLFLLLSLNVKASWQTYQNDLRNTGVLNGIGYFPLETTNFSNGFYGMSFQPLVDDLDVDSDNEIVIFSNQSLIIFDSRLNVLNRTKVGYLLGQPTLFNFDDDPFTEIIFNSRQNLTDYFFAYQYNDSSLHQEFNLTLSNEANFSGIKCLNLDGINSCIFKDKRNYVHIINMDSKIDNSYNTSIYNETRQTVPAIGDIDNDNALEAVFWFNEDNQGGYGFLVFDLGSKSLDLGFNNSGIVDNIFSPLILGQTEYHQLFKLKGQPVLVDLNKDNKLEIAASVFYDDIRNDGSFVTDWFTELFVYGSNGTKLFSKCDKNPVAPGLGCNDGSGQLSEWEGTNPFIIDYDKNGVDDICFTKDVKRTIGFILFYYMALNCYDYYGNELAKINLSAYEDGIKGTAMVADMNNDGEKELITSNNIYLLNGTTIFYMPIGETNQIAVDVDGNHGLDLLWTKGNQTKVFLDNNTYSIDLSINSDDINFFKFNETHINVSSLVRNLGQLTRDVKVIIYNTETLENNTALIKIKGGKEEVIYSILKLKEGDKVMVSVDYLNEIEESDETNNFAYKEFMGLPYVYVSIGAEQNPQLVLQEIKDYIKDNLVLGYYTEDKSSADIQIYPAKTHTLNAYDKFYTRNKYGWWYESFSTIDYFDKQYDTPYAGIVGSYILDGKNYIAMYGNTIAGDIAAAKEFIKRQADFLAKDSETVFVIDDENVDAIGVYDYLHQPGNEQYYGENSKEFANVVRNALNGETFSTELKTVTTFDGVELRLKHLIPNRSSTYMEILNVTGVPVEMPVVLARGLWSNLTSWEVFAGELTNEGRDIWLIEITGGPGQDCDSCPDYTFDDLTDKYVPTLLNAVLNFTGKDKIQYVGFSNGCRATLSSLEKNKFDPNKIETFVAVGCPGAFDGTSLFAECLLEHGNAILDHFTNNNISHPTQREFSEQLVRRSTTFSSCWLLGRFLDPDGRISKNLGQHYLNLTQSSQDTQPGVGTNLKKFSVIYGTNGFGSNNDNDYVVTQNDQLAMFNGIISTDKDIASFHRRHNELPDDKRVKNTIREELK